MSVDRAAWHCSWCFASSFLHHRKAMSYTHADRYSQDTHTPDYFCRSVQQRIREVGDQLSARQRLELHTPTNLPSPAEVRSRAQACAWVSM